ncbi:hypothetical protein [Pedobacter miscanthi]|jgi:hypothetical protein|uniref:hypothetical protein n=1 Tax=Pedobacter miscanthi TaxID=2259170 RepID=UPI00292F6BC1|nr:hypothetical protein [Pedobacter miscanthi]
MQIKSEKKRFESVNLKLRHVAALVILTVSTLNVSAQKSAVEAAFSKLGVDASILNPENVKLPEDYSFELKQSTTTAGKTNVIAANFDPASPKEERWTVVSVNGKSPSKGDINSFRKDRAKEHPATKGDDASYKIEKETADQLVFSYKIEATSLPKEAAFMKDCRIYMTVNLRTKKLEQMRTLNEKPVKIAMLTADKFELNSKVVLNADAKRYFPVNEELDMQAKFLGQSVSVQTVTAYSNYTKK